MRPYVVTVMTAAAERLEPWAVAVIVTGPAVAVEGAHTVPSEPTVARAGSEEDHVTVSLLLPLSMVTVAKRRMEVTKPDASLPDGDFALIVAEVGDTTTR